VLPNRAVESFQQRGRDLFEGNQLLTADNPYADPNTDANASPPRPALCSATHPLEAHLTDYLLLVVIGRQSPAESPFPEGIIEDEITHQSALFDPFGLIKAPVDAEIDAALAVLFFGRCKRCEITQNYRAHITLIVPRHPVELVRNEAEGDRIGPVKSAQRLEESAPEGRVAGRIRREGRREIRPVGVAGRRAERNEVRISDGAFKFRTKSLLPMMIRVPGIRSMKTLTSWRKCWTR
jgi:hypothetical protein